MVSLQFYHPKTWHESMVAQASFCHALALITKQHNKEQQTLFSAGFTAFFLADYLFGDMICQARMYLPRNDIALPDPELCHRKTCPTALDLVVQNMNYFITCILTSMHTYIHTFILAYINRYVHTYTSYICTYRHLCTCTYLHNYNKQRYSTMVKSKQNSHAQRVRREGRRNKRNNDQHLDSKLPEHLLLLPDCFPSHAATALCRNLRSLNCLNSHFVAVSAVSKCPKFDNHRVGRIQA